MERRRFVKTAGSLAAAGATGVTGCLGEGDASGENVVWEHGVGGRVDAVHNEMVYGREDWREGGKRGVFALDAAEGEREWTYGEIGGSSTYTPLVVDGGVYFGYGDDEVGSGAGNLYALDEDGGERWVRDVGSVYDAPVVKGGVVYAGSDRGAAHAFDAETGDELWSREFESPEEYATPTVGVETVEDGVAYVTAYGNLYAIDEENGDEIWRYDDDRVSEVEVSDGTVYASHSGRVAAYADGDELWTHEVEVTNPSIRGAAHGNVYFGHRRDLRALNARGGERVWSKEIGEDYPLVLGDSTVYAGERDLRALSPGGDELWTVDLDGSELDELSLAGSYVYAVTEDMAYRTEDGEVVSSTEVPGDEGANSHVVGDDEIVYVGTRGGVYALGV